MADQPNPWDTPPQPPTAQPGSNPWDTPALPGGGGSGSFDENYRDPAYGSTGRMDMSRQLMPDGSGEGQGEDYYGDPTGQVGGFGIGESMARDFKTWQNKKSSEFYAPVLVRQEDGTYKEADPNLFQKGSRLLRAEFEGVGDILGAGAKAVKGYLGVSRSLEDLGDIANSPLPDILKQDTGLNLFLNPLLNVYNAARIATGSRRLTSDEVLRGIDAGLQSSEIIYTSISDPTLRHEFNRRYLAGENPDYLTKELENPWHELVGELVLDPLNIIGSFTAKAGKAADVARLTEKFTSVLPEVKKLASIAPEFEQGVVAGLRAMDDSRSATVLPEIAKTIAQESLKVADGMKGSAGYGNVVTRRMFTSSARREMVSETMSSAFLPMMANYANDPDSAAMTVRALTLLGSGDATKTEEALRILKSLPTDLSNIALSQGGMETAAMLHRMGDPSDLINLFKAADKEEAILKFTSRMDAAVDELHPTLTQRMAGLQEKVKAGGELGAMAQKELDAIPTWAKAINNSHEAAQKILRPVNGFFSNVYIVANPGTQVRNLFGNMTHAFVDMGPQAAGDVLGNTVRAVGRGLKGDIESDLPADVLTKKMLGGTLPHGANVSLGTGTDQAGSLIPGWVKNAAQQTERAASSAVVYNSVKSTMKHALKEGGVVPKSAELVQAGLSEPAAKRYIDLMQTEFFGDHEKAWAKIQQEFADGIVESWRNPREWLSPADVKSFEQSGILQEIEDITHNATSLQDAMRGADAIVQRQIKQAAGVLDELPEKFIDDLGDDFDLAGDGFLLDDQMTEFAIKRTAMANARNSFEKVATNILNDPSVPKSLLSEFNAFLQGPLRGKAADNSRRVMETATKASKLISEGKTQDAWTLLQKTAYGKDLPDFPAGAAAQELRDFIWQKWAYPTRSTIWSDVANATRQKSTELAQRALQAIGKPADALTQSPEYLKAEQAWNYAQQVEGAKYVSGRGLVFDAVADASARQDMPKSIAALAKRYGISTATEAGGPSDSRLLNTINKYSDGDYKSIKDIPFEVAQSALKKRAEEKGIAVKETLEEFGERLPVPRYFDSETMPTGARMAAEGLSGTTQSVSRFKSQLQKVWGQGETVQRLTPEIEEAMSKIGARSMQRMTEARVVASAVANHQRDFTLLGYGKKTYLDLALSYVMPYSFYHTRATAHWIKRLVTDPQIAANYYKYRRAMESAHANLPPWWKYNINSDEVLGIQTDHPLMFNLEATLNPLNAMTGIDYDDPDRVVGAEGSGMRWWTQTLDGMGKFGPSVWTPLTMATAYVLHQQGQKEAALAWGGRAIPHTAVLKSLSSYVGQPLELDPAVLMFGKGEGSNNFFDAKDKFERSRIGQAAAKMIIDGVPEAEMLRQLAEEKGPLYDQAYRAAIQLRAPAQLLSFIGGSGFKTRTKEDVQVDKFYQEYRSLWAQHDALNPDEFSTAMNEMHEKFPFMDAVILSKRAGTDRDRGYAYTVMQRIPPGSNKEVGEFVGLDPRLLDKFYEDKGDVSKWPKSDKDIFFAKIADIGATLDVPDTAVRQEWLLAKNEYSKMGATAKTLFGNEIDNLVTTFYETDSDFKEQFLTQHPEVREYMTWKNGYIANEPILSTYYDGMANLTDYWQGKFREEAVATYGKDFFKTLSDYYIYANYDKKQAEAFKKAHPEISKYYKLKEDWDIKINRYVADFGKRLPEGIPPQLQPGRDEKSFGEQDLRAGIQQQGPQWADIAPTLSQDVQAEVEDYFSGGKKLTYYAQGTLERVAKDMGISLNELLQMAGKELDWQYAQ